MTCCVIVLLDLLLDDSFNEVSTRKIIWQLILSPLYVIIIIIERHILKK